RASYNVRRHTIGNDCRKSVARRFDIKRTQLNKSIKRVVRRRRNVDSIGHVRRVTQIILALMLRRSACLALIMIVTMIASSSEPAAFLARVAGVYKSQFQNGNIDGDKYQSEDVLEVVPVDDHSAYVRMDLEFFNGHSGMIYGIATYGNHSLIYDNHKPGDER